MQKLEILTVPLSRGELQAIIKQAVSDAVGASTARTRPESGPTFTKVPAKQIYDPASPGRLMSKPTFYKLVGDGRIHLFKIGSRSFVDLAQVNDVFQKIKVKTDGSNRAHA